MKKLLKIFIYFIVVVIALVIVLTVIAKLAENKITDIALKKVSETIEAPVLIDNVSFNLLRKFPLATIELDNVLLGAPKTPNTSDSLSKKAANSNVCTRSGQSNPFWHKVIKPVKLAVMTIRTVPADEMPLEGLKIYVKTC